MLLVNVYHQASCCARAVTTSMAETLFSVSVLGAVHKLCQRPKGGGGLENDDIG